MEQKIDLMKKMSFSDNFVGTFKFFKENFGFLFKSIAFFFIPLIILTVVMNLVLVDDYNNFFAWYGQILSDPSSFNFADSGFGDVMTLLANSSLFTIGISLLIMYIGAASVKAIGSRLVGENLEPKEVAVAALKKTVPILITGFIAGLMYIVAILLCVIPIFPVMIYMTFVSQAIMLEDKHYGKAIGRSFSMVNKNFWQIVLIGLVIGIMYSIISRIITLPVSGVSAFKTIKSIVQSGGEIDPSAMGNMYTDMFGESGILAAIISAITVVLGIVYAIILNIAMTLKFINIRNIREGTDLLNKIETEKNIGQRTIIE